LAGLSSSEDGASSSTARSRPRNTSSEAALFEISSKSACTFPWTSMIASAVRVGAQPRHLVAQLQRLGVARATSCPRRIADGGLQQALAVLATPVGDEARVETFSTDAPFSPASLQRFVPARIDSCTRD